MIPLRLSLLTYNLWNIQRWPMREAALRHFFLTYPADIICLQELRIETRDVLDEILPRHRRVADDFPGWERESSIFWNVDLLEEVEHGTAEIGHQAEKHRRLFWPRLRVRETGKTLFTSTAHYTYQENPEEVKTGQSPRAAQAYQTVAALQHLVKEGEPAFFMGDLNDPILPALILKDAGYRTCFDRLGLLPPVTWPAMPTMRMPASIPLSSQTIDWMVSNDLARPLIAAAVQYYYEDFAPSDHWPLYAVYEL